MNVIMTFVTTVLLPSFMALAFKAFFDKIEKKSRQKREDQQQEQRLKREDRIRFHSERRAAYVRFLVLARQLYFSVHQSALNLYNEDKERYGDILPIDEERNPLPIEISPELREVYEVILLLATPSVREAARQLHQCLPRVVSAVYGPDWYEGLKKIGQRLEVACNAFHVAAREELGIEEPEEEDPSAGSLFG